MLAPALRLLLPHPREPPNTQPPSCLLLSPACCQALLYACCRLSLMNAVPLCCCVFVAVRRSLARPADMHTCLISTCTCCCYHALAVAARLLLIYIRCCLTLAAATHLQRLTHFLPHLIPSDAAYAACCCRTLDIMLAK